MKKAYIRYLIFALFVLVGLYIASTYSYLLFHSIAEIFSILIAFIIFTIAWNSRKIVNNEHFLFLGISFLFVGCIDFLHTISYKGMAIFIQTGSNLPTQLWISARYMQSLSFLLAPLFFRRNLKDWTLLFSFLIVFIVLLLSIFYWEIFPVCYVEGTGLTAFKKISEYIVSIIFFSSFLLLVKFRDRLERDVFYWITGGILLTIISEMAFTYYIDVYGLSNLIGHFLKIVAFWFLYMAFVETTFNNPYNMLFRDLKKSEEKYRSLFNNMIDGFARHRIVVNQEGKPIDYIFLEVNSAFEKFTGLSRDSLINKRVTEVIPGIEKDPADWIGRYGKVAMTGESARFESYAEHLRRWYNVLAYSTEREFFVTLFEDITERKQMEEMLKEAKQKLEIDFHERTIELTRANELLETIISHIPVMICLFDSEGRIKFINQEFETLTGWGIENAAESCIMKSPDSETGETYREMQQYMKEPRPGWWDFLIRTSTGQNLETCWANVRLSDGSIIGIGIDITDRKMAEERLKTYLDQLQKSNRNLEEFAFIASHDLKEPLRKIRTFGDLLTSKSGDSLDDTGKDYVARMQKASLRMQTLIESLLTYSRVSTDATRLSLVNLNEAIREAINNLELRIMESGASVESDDLPTIEADISQMTQLFQNLIGNGLKFSRENTPPIIRIYARPVEEQVNTNSLSYRIYVEDNGIGFKEKYLDRIFAPFQRIHGRGLYEGVGMGLAICNRIVMRHNGSITAKSEIGKGSTFIITLPMKHVGEDHEKPFTTLQSRFFA